MLANKAFIIKKAPFGMKGAFLRTIQVANCWQSDRDLHQDRYWQCRLIPDYRW